MADDDRHAELPAPRIGSTAFAFWHVGRWTMPATKPGEALQPGRRRTPDEGNFDVIGLARILGRRLSPVQERQIRLWQNELRPTHTRESGHHVLADPDNSAALYQAAREAFDWLAVRAPAGYRFVWTDAIYLEPLMDITAETVAVDAVVRLARDRGVESSVSQLACAHVRQSASGWIVGDAVLTLGGPFAEISEAIGEVRTARNALAEYLRHSGCADLADTTDRWPAVPITTATADRVVP